LSEFSLAIIKIPLFLQLQFFHNRRMFITKKF